MAKKKVSLSAKKPTSTKSKSSGTKSRTKSEILTALAAETELSKKQVAAVVESLTVIMKKDLSKAGTFTLAGVFKATVVRKPATKARKGINPFTKEEVVFKAKPARNAVKIRALKALKEAV